MEATAHILPCGQRMHLQHGPSDLIVFAEGDREPAFRAAKARFETIIAEVMSEICTLRRTVSTFTKTPDGTVARRMYEAACLIGRDRFVTPMAAVAGAIADEVLAAMLAGAPLRRAYVNNGGDIALHLAPGTSFSTAMIGHDGTRLGTVQIGATDTDATDINSTGINSTGVNSTGTDATGRVRGIATSGRHGRSLSLGVADSVTVLASSAAKADVAATLIGNAVDLPDHPAIRRRPASDVTDNSDLGDLPVVVGCGPLTKADRAQALQNGCRRADRFVAAGHIAGAGLFLQGHGRTTGSIPYLTLNNPENINA